MAKKYAMRLNIYLDDEEPKDKIIIDFLSKKYSEVGFIKETMYALATGSSVEGFSISPKALEIAIDKSGSDDEPLEEYEEIRGIGDIEM